jgi:hypothetical protein
MSLFANPIKWANSAVKSKSRMFLLMALQLMLLLFGLWIFHDSLSDLDSYTDLSILEFMGAISFVFVAGAWMPFTYLYCLYRLLKIIKDERNIQ